jgi:NAD(P)-dependent dehydrogenase (short-subunit alcohol dehydrogenase family)
MRNQPRPQVVVVTGASGGIGRAIAHAFAKRGAHLGLLARGQPGLEAAAEEVRSLGGRAIVIPTDMTDPELVEAAADAVEARFGSIDAWVNDAMATVFARVVDTHPEEFKRATEVTYLGTGPPSTTAASCGSASPPYKQSRATNWRPGSPTATSPKPPSTASRSPTCPWRPIAPTTCSSRAPSRPPRTASSTTGPRHAVRSCGPRPTGRPWRPPSVPSAPWQRPSRVPGDDRCGSAARAGHVLREYGCWSTANAA